MERLELVRLLSERDPRQVAFVLIMGWAVSACAQVNSWVKPSSGSWEESQWSLGVLPGSGQSVMITNEGWKAVAIRASTAQNYSQTLNANSITISPPTNTLNTLLLNSAGLQNPLSVRFLTVASNSAMTMLSSALQLNGGGGEGMLLGGEFNQSDFSVVTGQQMDVGSIGPGLYNLNSGTLALNQIWVGSRFAGVFNQNGGSNGVGIVHLENGGTYNFRGGDFGANVYFSSSNTLFRQTSGVLNARLAIWKGGYVLESGAKCGSLSVPSEGYGNGNAWALQTGGTNFGPIQLGYFGYGTYTLSNGVVMPSSFVVNYYGNFTQYDGSVSATGGVSVVGGWLKGGDRPLGYYTLAGGLLSSPEIYMNKGYFLQTGGTNSVAGNLRLVSDSHNYYDLKGGALSVSNTSLGASWVGGFFQSGGVHRVADELLISGNDRYGPYSWNGYVLSGGQLIVPNISVSSRGIFNQTGGRVTQSGLLSLLNARMYTGPGDQQFGELQLSATDIDTNTTLHMPADPCVAHFRDSSALIWSNSATLTIENWAGSLFGGGAHQIIFGNGPSALTSQQLSQIFFRDPSGLVPGLYSAKIFSNGEITPNALPPTGRVPPTTRIAAQPDRAMRVTVLGESGADYGVEISSNLVNWTFWTNWVATNGTISLMDTEAANYPQRFYRAVLRP